MRPTGPKSHHLVGRLVNGSWATRPPPRAQARRTKGESPTRIAEALGVSRASVYRHLARAEGAAVTDPE